jgi:sucrose 6(F)-phosphate phosphorylase
LVVKNQVQLITYPDSLGGDLRSLHYVLEKYFPNLFTGGIHILPPFPSSGDRGFAPLTYLEIEPHFGTWDDIKRIGEKHAILLDLMVNHISAKSAFFQDFIKNGRDSKYSDLFITLDKVWSNGKPVKEEVDKIFLRRVEPFSEFRIQKTGQIEKVWTTFGKTSPSEQIDLDVISPMTKDLISKFMENFHKNGVKIVRLDAVGYVIKKRGTTCFFVEPDIFQYLSWISSLANSLNIEILPEIHAEYTTQLRLAKERYWIYDFILPYAVMDAFINKTSKRLKKYLKIRPHNQFTMLDCHDGIPIKPDLNGLYHFEDAKKVVDVCRKRGANFSLILSPEHKDPDGFDVHQLRGTIYSLLGCNDNLYLAARAIQLFTPGIPQVYYVGLLAGKNDEVAVSQTGEGRDINRHNYSIEEIDMEVGKPVVMKLLRMIQLRNSHPAFNGVFKINRSSDHEISLTWTNQDKYATLYVDLLNNSSTILYSDISSDRELVFI